jgi:death-on-curing protein
VSEVPVEIEFLTVEVVLALHQRQLDRFGGGAGLRDRGLLESAIAQP